MQVLALREVDIACAQNCPASLHPQCMEVDGLFFCTCIGFTRMGHMGFTPVPAGALAGLDQRRPHEISPGSMFHTSVRERRW